MKAMVVRTTRSFPCPPRTVWTLMCNSRMDYARTLPFRLGVPQPVQCRVTDGHGGVGSERECISDQGVVNQRILVWAPERRLMFRMERTDMDFQRFVQDIVDTFDLVPSSSGVTVTRTTEVSTKGRFAIIHRFTLFVSLKQVHRFVFRNWLRLAKQATASPSPAERASPDTSIL